MMMTMMKTMMTTMMVVMVVVVVEEEKACPDVFYFQNLGTLGIAKS